MNQANDVIPQGDVIVVEDYVDARCVRHVHLMSNAPFGFAAFPQIPQGDGVAPDGCNLGEEKLEAGVWHYRAEYAYRGVLDIACVGSQKKFRRFVVWSFDGYTSIKVALYDAWKEYCRLFGGKPEYGFIRTLPANVENGVEVGGMIVMEADWMLERCVAVGGRL